MWWLNAATEVQAGQALAILRNILVRVEDRHDFAREVPFKRVLPGIDLPRERLNFAGLAIEIDPANYRRWPISPTSSASPNAPWVVDWLPNGAATARWWTRFG